MGEISETKLLRYCATKVVIYKKHENVEHTHKIVIEIDCLIFKLTRHFNTAVGREEKEDDVIR